MSDKVTESRSLPEKHSTKGEKNREKDASNRDRGGAKRTDITDDDIRTGRKIREHFANPSEPQTGSPEEVRISCHAPPQLEERVRAHPFFLEGAKAQWPK
jgi:predicted phage gp36 major capsid-like protein